MARKSWMYSVFEAVQFEMRQDKNMIWVFELTPPVASTPGKPVINLEKEFGRNRVVNTGIDENWMASCVIGAGLAGSKAVTYIPYQGNAMCFQVIQNHAGKLRSMTGGMASLPIVFILEMTGQTPGFAGQHSDYEIDRYYTHIPGVKTVVPSTPSDAKGMMVSAIRDPNPVVYLWPAGARPDGGSAQQPVHDPARQGGDPHHGQRHHHRGLRRRHAGGDQATEALQKQGMKVEAIDLRSLKPMDTETLVKSVQKTKYLLAVDQSYYTLGPGAEVVARCAENVTAHTSSAWPSPTRRHRRPRRCSTGCGRTRTTCGRGRDETARMRDATCSRSPPTCTNCGASRRAPRGCPLGLLA